MIAFQGIKKSFGGITILEDVTFDVQAGTRVSLLGPGGCGKSTVLKILLGLLEPDQGVAKLMGVDMTRGGESEKRAVLRQVGMAFQQGALFDFMTVGENLIFAMENMTDFDAAVMEERIKRLLEGVKLGRTRHQFPYELSGGMQRRVGIARALTTSPRIAIFDEPTAGLDPVTSTIILNMILELGGEHTDNTLLVATSSVEVAIRFAERLILMNEGRIVADGPWRQLLLEGAPWVQHFLSVRLIGLDPEYAQTLDLPRAFIERHWGA